MATTAERGYGAAHQAERARWAPFVEAGQTYCAELICLEDERWIEPGTHWDLAHDRASGPDMYLGPAHERCNRSEGARWGAALRAGTAGDGSPPPRRWPT